MSISPKLGSFIFVSEIAKTKRTTCSTTRSQRAFDEIGNNDTSINFRTEMPPDSMLLKTSTENHRFANMLIFTQQESGQTSTNNLVEIEILFVALYKTDSR